MEIARNIVIQNLQLVLSQENQMKISTFYFNEFKNVFKNFTRFKLANNN